MALGERREDENGSAAAPAADRRAPAISRPPTGGAIRGIGETFAANPATGTGSMQVPIATSPGRSGFGPTLSLGYDTGLGNGPFGLGWTLGLPTVTRRTDLGLPRYGNEDTFLLAGAEDLVPLRRNDGGFETEVRDGHRIQLYMPRTEGVWARIERWTHLGGGEVHWRTITAANVTTLYGTSAGSRVADPSRPDRVFSWLVAETYDDKGNRVVYEYAEENSDGVEPGATHERNRTPSGRTAGRYPKRISYGNEVSRLVDPDPADPGWHFEVVFDYDEGHLEELPPVGGERRALASSTPGHRWRARPDPFSRHRAGFELRTYRRCRRVLMFHRFKELGPDPCLVRSTEFGYTDGAAGSLLRSVTQSGYVGTGGGATVRDGARFSTYEAKSLPPLEFEYTEAEIDPAVRVVESPVADNLPVGIDPRATRWVDLDGEGLVGVLTAIDGAWYYKRNLGPGRGRAAAGGGRPGDVRLGSLERLPAVPTPPVPAAERQLLDLDGDGALEVVDLGTVQAGSFRRGGDGGWEPWRAFDSNLNRTLRDPNVRFIDLTGRGLPDLLIGEDEAIAWHPSCGRDGFGERETAARSVDEEDGPQLLFAGGGESIHLADFCGDGLQDVVRIRNGEVCYWPNLGYGRFGAKVTMDNAPWFDPPDQFDPARLRLADLDGSGLTDIVYLGSDGVRLHPNESGNRWGPERGLGFPHAGDAPDVSVVDLLGDGTACLVWSSPLPGDAAAPLRYVRLLERKPHLLCRVVNNQGAETAISYAPSTAFHAEDRAAGRPWATRLPFPLQVIERVESADHVTGNRFVTRYAYHHGHYDGVEREFRGFAMVEQWDSAEFAGGEFEQAPVVTRSWFHTGSPPGGPEDAVLQGEWHGEHRYLPEARLPAGLDAEELRQAARALKGGLVRREVYSFDGSPQQEHPYSIAETCHEVRLVRGRNGGDHAVFQPLSRESVSLQLEREPGDPRITHGVNLVFDELGNVLRSASIAYGRRSAEPSLATAARADQERTFVTVSEVDHTEDQVRTEPQAVHRLRVPLETRSFELTGAAPAGEIFTAAELERAIREALPLGFEEEARPELQTELRLLSRTRTTFLDDDLEPLPFGAWDSRGLAARSYGLAFTASALAAFYDGAVTDADLEAAGYVHFEGDSDWWIPSGLDLYPDDAPQRFYLPVGDRDPFGIETLAEFDAYALLPERIRVRQAPWQETRAVNDYRMLGPVETVDANGNRSAVAIDALGHVVRSALMGRPGSGDGDTLADPTVRMDYTLDAWRNEGRPNSIRIRSRERHGAANPGWRESWTYANGSGGTALVKAQAAPGPALAVAGDGTVSEVHADPRWIGTGRTVLDNKGNAVQTYDPYFSTTHEYEEAAAVRELGVSPRFHYDPLGRNVRTDAPNGTHARVEFGPWGQRLFDANDTVADSLWYAERGSPAVSSPEPTDPERRAAWLAAAHAGTAAAVHFDAFGRVVEAVADHGGGIRSSTRSHSDLTGHRTVLFDQAGRMVSSATKAMSGATVATESAERGRAWTFVDVSGAVVRSWDEHGRGFRAGHDALRRRVSLFVQEPGEEEVLTEHVVYGDRHPDARARNLLGVPHLIFDQAGQVRIPRLDFEGTPERTERILARYHEGTIDWSGVASRSDYADIQPAAEPLLAGEEVFTTSTTIDALGRTTGTTLADGTVVVPSYDVGAMLSGLVARPGGSGPAVKLIRGREHDAKGRPLLSEHGNGTVTRYSYDRRSRRLERRLTLTGSGGSPADALQDLRYTYDPVGNVVELRDGAQQTHFFNNAVVEPHQRFAYDPTYQLVRASGREHAGAANSGVRDHRDADVASLPHPNDQQAVRTYSEEYEYDLLGNLLRMRHRFRTQSGAGAGWTRGYRYARDGDPADRTNRLVATSAPGDAEGGPFSAGYDHDAHGNMTRMPHLPRLEWDATDRLRRVDLGGGGTAHHVYGSGGQRVRRIVDREGDLRLEWIYLGAAVLFRRRRRSSGSLRLERWSTHLEDGGGPAVRIDTKTVDHDGLDPDNPVGVALLRYQHGNGLGSAALETDADGTPLSYEEFHPFGTSAYRSVRSGYDAGLKRYRFGGKERDEESGLYYFGGRFYAPWLGRWTSSDPAGFANGFNLFRYCNNSPTTHADPTGTQAWRTDWSSHNAERDPVTHTAIDTVEEFERWAVRHGIEYEGTPTVVPGGFTVQRWRQVEPGAGGPAPSTGTSDGEGTRGAPGQGTATSLGEQTVRTHPEGHIHEVAENFDDGKVAAYRERAQTDRGIAIRSREPGGRSRTADLRRQNQGLRDNFEASLRGGGRPTGTQIDHTVELQDIGRHNNTVRPQDHRVQPSGQNASQGSSQMHVNRRRIAEGIPEDVPAGAVARTSEMGDPRLQPGFRARVRGAGYALVALGPVLTAWGSSNVENAAVRRTGYGLAAGEAAGGSMYVAGRALMGGGAAGNPAGLQMMARGAGVMRVAGGAAGVVLGGYALVSNYEAGEYGRMLGDASSVVGGGAVLAGAAPVAAVAAGVGAANLAGDWVESAVTPGHGRTAGVAAGTAAGAATGALIGAAVGVWFFGVGAGVGAAVGAVVGAIAGFIGAFW